MSYEYDKKEDFEQAIAPASIAEVEEGATQAEGLHRQLKARHIAMISLGGVM